MYESFAEGYSFLHRMDTRLKLLLAIAGSVSIALTRQFEPAILLWFVYGMLVILARFDLKKVLHRLLLINGFTVFLWIFLPFQIRVASSESLIGIDQSGIYLATLLTLKINSVTLLMIATLGSSHIHQIANAMGAFRFPVKLTFLLLITYRYLTTISQEYQKLSAAARIRCFKPATSIHTYKTYAYLIGMVLTNSAVKGQRVYNAMLCRGFNGQFHSLSRSHIQSGHLLISISILILTILSVLLPWNLLPQL